MGPEPVGGGEVKLGIKFSVIQLSGQCLWRKTHVSSILQAGHNLGRKLIGRNARVRVRHVDYSYRNMFSSGRYLCESKALARVSVNPRRQSTAEVVGVVGGIDDDKCPEDRRPR